MMFYSILASFCLLGIARSQTIDSLTACLTKDQNLEMDCNFTPLEDKGDVTCSYKVDDKVVATSDGSAVDPTYKNRATVSVEKNACKLILKGLEDEQAKEFQCIVKQTQTESTTLGKEVQKKNLNACSAGNNLKNAGVVLLLALVLPLLSGML